MAIHLFHQGLQQMTQLETIMIVDPDVHTRSLLQESISNADFDVITADSGRQGLDLCGEQMPSLILMNFHLPDMDSARFCLAFSDRVTGQDVPLVIVTEGDDVEAIKQAYARGAPECIVKPLNLVLLGHRRR